MTPSTRIFIYLMRYEVEVPQNSHGISDLNNSNTVNQLYNQNNSCDKVWLCWREGHFEIKPTEDLTITKWKRKRKWHRDHTHQQLNQL